MFLTNKYSSILIIVRPTLRKKLRLMRKLFFEPSSLTKVISYVLVYDSRNVIVVFNGSHCCSSLNLFDLCSSGMQSHWPAWK